MLERHCMRQRTKDRCIRFGDGTDDEIRGSPQPERDEVPAGASSAGTAARRCIAALAGADDADASTAAALLLSMGARVLSH